MKNLLLHFASKGIETPAEKRNHPFTSLLSSPLCPSSLPSLHLSPLPLSPLFTSLPFLSLLSFPSPPRKQPRSPSPREPSPASSAAGPFLRAAASSSRSCRRRCRLCFLALLSSLGLGLFPLSWLPPRRRSRAAAAARPPPPPPPPPRRRTCSRAPPAAAGQGEPSGERRLPQLSTPQSRP